MKYYILTHNLMRLKKNQRVHIMDKLGKMYCQLENMKRRKPLGFTKIIELEDRPICKLCIEIEKDWRLT